MSAEEICPRSRRVDGNGHSWVFDGDDPYVVCAFCSERRDALTGRVMTPGRGAPVRIQRLRTKGWRMPEGAVYVGRPTRWGNPFTVMNGHRQGWLVWDDRDRLGLAPGYSTSGGYLMSFRTREEAATDAVKRYRKWLTGAAARVADLTPELRGHDLACWCPPGLPCHADVLLELANQGRP